LQCVCLGYLVLRMQRPIYMIIRDAGLLDGRKGKMRFRLLRAGLSEELNEDTYFQAVEAADKGTGTTRPAGAPLAVVEAKPKPQKPSLYRVLILNDDYTPMEFVVYVLERFFNKSREDATRVMLHVHQTGVGVCGVYTYEVAETKVAQVVDMARRHQHPLQCTMEKD
jgi:ATP-dependent Clp protease adaptor protein ClpS